MNQLVNPEGAAAQAPEIIGAIVAVLRERTGCDFSRYRPATVYRRIRNRMISLGIASLPDYLTLLESTEDETLRLLERVTIKVSRFYRNPETFDLLRRQVLPALAEERRGSPVRVWSAGCGRGEEAYTLAMLLDEVGVPGFVEASDVDPAALDGARAGIYGPGAVADLPAELAARYLEPVSAGERQHYGVGERLRARVRFSLHDLTSSEPTPGEGRFDLACCRNVLIYLQRDLQARTLRGVHGAVEPGGFLCLGEAEWPAALPVGSLASLGRKTHVFRVLCNLSGGVAR